MLRRIWSKEETQKIQKLYSIYGTKWRKISSYFNDRTDDSIRNFINRHLVNKHSIIKKTPNKYKHERQLYTNDEDECIIRKIIDGFNYTDIGKALNRTPHSVRNRYNRIKQCKTYKNIQLMIYKNNANADNESIDKDHVKKEYQKDDEQIEYRKNDEFMDIPILTNSIEEFNIFFQ